MKTTLIPYPNSALFLLRVEGLQGTYSLLLTDDQVDDLVASILAAKGEAA